MTDDSKREQHKNRSSRRASRTRQRLLDAALLVFGDRGVDACTVEDITERADLGKGTFYRHFEDKATLIRVLLEMAVAQLLERMTMRREKIRTLAEVIDHIVQAHITFYMDFSTTYAFLLQNQLAARSRRGTPIAGEEPILRYIGAIEAQLAASLPHPSDPATLKMAACGLAGWIAGFFTVGGLALGREALAASAGQLRMMAANGVTAYLSTTHGAEPARQSA